MFLCKLNTVNADWLSGWTKRITITIDHTKLDSDLTWFPVTIFLKPGNGGTASVFKELGANSKKIAITQSDGTTQLYAEVETWDATSSKAVLHVSKTGWTISSSTDTIIYLYYDKNQTDNTTYVGVTGDSPAQSVWDGNFLVVYHMNDASTTKIIDSTANINTGTKKSAGEPVEITGLVGKTQSFDGNNDYAYPTNNIASANISTIECIANLTQQAQTKGAYNHLFGSQLYQHTANNFFYCYGTNDYYNWIPSIATNYHLAWVFPNTMASTTGSKLYHDGVSVNVTQQTGSHAGALFQLIGSSVNSWYGLIDEVRISNTARQASWIKTTNYSLRDSLLSYGPEVFCTSGAMCGNTYMIIESSINSGGQDNQTSTSYRLRETIGEVGVGDSTSTSYKLRSGYQPMLESYLSLSVSTDSVAMLPNIGGVTGGTATGSFVATVITDNTAGYSLYVNASTSPSLKSSTSNFTDYTLATANKPDYSWSILSNTSEFGFSPEGNDIIQKFKDDGSSICATGTNDTAEKCWYNFSTSNELIGLQYFANNPSGSQINIKMQAQSGSNNIQAEGLYQGTIITTAVTN